jgi:hypothetical protein
MLKKTLLLIALGLCYIPPSWAQAVPNCFFEPWLPTSGDAVLTVCSSKNIAGCTSVVGNASAAGGVAVMGFNLAVECSTSKIEYIVKTPDASVAPVHHYALGIFCQSGNCTPGTLYVQTAVIPSGTGPGTFTPSAASGALVTQNWQGVDAGNEGGCATIPCVLPAGVYGLVVGSDCVSNCAVLYGDADSGTLYAFDNQNQSLNSPWAFDPINGLPFSFTPVPVIAPTAMASPYSGLAKPPTVLIF